MRQRSEEIVSQWLDRVLDAYHREAKDYILREKDRFLNPIGSTYREGLQAILSWLLNDSSSGIPTSHLTDILKIACLNGYSPKDGTLTGLLILSLEGFQEIMERFKDPDIQGKLRILSTEEEKAYAMVREKIESLRKRAQDFKVFRKLKG